MGLMGFYGFIMSVWGLYGFRLGINYIGTRKREYY